jgi:hypothetical protein
MKFLNDTGDFYSLHIVQSQPAAFILAEYSVNDCAAAGKGLESHGRFRTLSSVAASAVAVRRLQLSVVEGLPNSGNRRVFLVLRSLLPFRPGYNSLRGSLYNPGPFRTCDDACLSWTDIVRQGRCEDHPL